MYMIINSKFTPLVHQNHWLKSLDTASLNPPVMFNKTD